MPLSFDWVMDCLQILVNDTVQTREDECNRSSSFLKEQMVGQHEVLAVNVEGYAEQKHDA